MPYLCSYDFCGHAKGGLRGKEIAEGEAVACSKCGMKKPFHKDCFQKHNQEKHSGKAIAKPLEEVEFPY